MGLLEKHLSDQFIEDLFQYLTGTVRPSNCLLIKRHLDNLDSHGDYSFPFAAEPWNVYVSNNSQNSGLIMGLINSNNIKDVCQMLVNESNNWELLLSKCFISKGRVCMCLDRSQTFRRCLSNIDICLRKYNRSVASVKFVTDALGSDISTLRLNILVNVARNLSIYNGFKVISHESNDDCITIFMTLKSSCTGPNNAQKVLCGSVLNALSGSKENSYSGDDYIRRRRRDMQLIAEHKFGVRFQSADEKWKDFINHLGEAAATFELLQVKPSHAVTVNFDDHGNGNTKGAAFVLYNCARLATLIETYRAKERNGTYPPLPPLEDVEFSLLSDEDEWILLFNYILGFGPTIEQCLDISSKGIRIAPHILCGFLSAMVRTFSMYYRRVRILTEPRSHLMPVLQARIHLLSSLQTVMHTALELLNIKPVKHM